MSPSVSEYYRFYHPSLFRLIGNVATAYRRQGKPVSVCGEMGGDPAAAAALVGLGIRRLSMGSSSVPRIKKMLSKLRIEDMEGLAVQAQALSTEAEVRAMLQAAVQ
jgi:phosphotransferase system enzyme I (PtsI)